MSATKRGIRGMVLAGSACLSASMPVALRLSAMSGEGAAPAVAGTAAAAGVGVGAFKLFAKAEVFTAKTAVGVGKFGAAKFGVITAETGNLGIIEVSEHDAAKLLNSVAESKLATNPNYFSGDSFTTLKNKYPDYSAYQSGKMTLDDFIERNPKFLDDASLDIYSKNPTLFATEFSESWALRIHPEEFGKVVASRINEVDTEDVEGLLSAVEANLSKKGFSTADLTGMKTKASEKLIEKALSQEIDKALKEDERKWVYKSGTLTIKGNIGHFEYEQELSASTIRKLIFLGGTVKLGYKIAWDKNTFIQTKACIEDFCLNAD